MPAAVPLAIVGSAAVGAAASSSASRNTTRAAERTAATNNDLQREVYNRNTGNMQPYLEGGNRSYAAWQDFMGLTDRPQAQAPQQPGGPQVQPAVSTGGGLVGGGGGGGYSGRDTALSFGGQDMALASGEGGTPMRPGSNVNALNGYEAPPVMPLQPGAEPQTWPTQPGQPDATGAGAGVPNALSGYDRFRASTGYETGLAEGYRGLNTRLAGQGRLQSGDAQREAVRYGQNYADSFATNYLDRLMQGTQVGTGAANALAGVGTNYANATSANNNNALNATANANASNASTIGGLAGAAGSAAAYYYGNRPPPTTSSYGGGNASSGYGRPIFWG